MKYVEEIIDDKNIIHVRVKGELHAKETAEMGSKIRTKALKHGYKIILDFKETTNYVSIIEGHTWFNDYYDKINIKLRFIPTVHLTNKANEKFFYFIETSWRNRGIRIKAMDDLEAAIKYLESF